MHTATIPQCVKALQRFVDVLYPPRCAGCQHSGYVLCPSCFSQIHPLFTSSCQRCSSPLSPSGACPTCQYAPLKVTGLRAVSYYQEPLRSCIHALKYNGNIRVAEPLGALLAQPPCSSTRSPPPAPPGGLVPPPSPPPEQNPSGVWCGRARLIKKSPPSTLQGETPPTATLGDPLFQGNIKSGGEPIFREVI